MNTNIVCTSTSKSTPPMCYDPKEKILKSSGTRPLFTRGSGENKPIFLHLANSDISATCSSDAQQKFLANENEALGTNIYSYDENINYLSENNPFLIRAFQCLDNLSQLPPNWDDYHAESPSIDAINQTRLFLKNCLEIFCSFLTDGLRNPNITANSEGDVVLEWWCNNKKLTLYVSSEETTYIKVAGEKIEDMEDGTLMTAQNNTQLSSLLSWLTR